jgi:hypothetical protein
MVLVLKWLLLKSSRIEGLIDIFLATCKHDYYKMEDELQMAI